MLGLLLAKIVENDLERIVAPEMASQLLKTNFIFFCNNCRCFHLENQVTWDQLNDHIQTLLN